MHPRVKGDPLGHDLPQFPPPQPGYVDLWSLDPILCGGQLSCSKPRTLLYYATSPGTAYISAGALSQGKSEVEIKVVGPVADDGARLFVTFTLTRKHILMWTEEEKNLFAAVLLEHMKYAGLTLKTLGIK